MMGDRRKKSGHLGLCCNLRGKRTAYSTRVKKRFLLAFITLLFTFAGAAIGAEEQRPDNILQPQGLNHAGIYKLREIDPNLTGAGVKFALICRSITYTDGQPQNDYQPGTNHNCFADKNFNFHDENKLPAEISTHSTAICSVLFGQDPNASCQQLGKFNYQGTAPKALADIYEFWHFLTNNVFSQSPPNADILTAGIGSQFEDWWTRGIESLAEHHGLIVVAGIGNGSNARDLPLYPAAGSNVIGVGVVDSVNSDDLETSLANFALAYPQHSSSGPTDDGRCKPDIVAPGNFLVADPNDTQSYSPTGNFSSFSTPLVAGTIGLLVQKAKQQPDLSAALSPQGGNCAIKAILLNSATKLPFWHKGKLETDDDHFAPLDYIQGAGMLNAVDAYKQLTAGQNKPGDCSDIGWDLNQLSEVNTKNTYKINTAKPEGKIITATATWNNHYKNSYPFKAMPEKDANLRLELWAIDSNDSNNNSLLDYSDSNVDNLEHIFHPADVNHTRYEIVVSISDIEDANQPAQQYALAWKISDIEDDDSIFFYDLNADGIVNELDFTTLIDNWQESIKTEPSYTLGDINSDGKINIYDLQLLLEHLNQKATWYKD